MKLDDKKAIQPNREIAKIVGSNEKKKMKQTELDMIFSGELKQWQKRKETLTLNTAKAYALIIIMYCSKTL